MKTTTNIGGGDGGHHLIDATGFLSDEESN